MITTTTSTRFAQAALAAGILLGLAGIHIALGPGWALLGLGAGLTAAGALFLAGRRTT